MKCWDNCLIWCFTYRHSRHNQFHAPRAKRLAGGRVLMSLGRKLETRSSKSAVVWGTRAQGKEPRPAIKQPALFLMTAIRQPHHQISATNVYQNVIFQEKCALQSAPVETKHSMSALSPATRMNVSADSLSTANSYLICNNCQKVIRKKVLYQAQFILPLDCRILFNLATYDIALSFIQALSLETGLGKWQARLLPMNV